MDEFGIDKKEETVTECFDYDWLDDEDDDVDRQPKRVRTFRPLTTSLVLYGRRRR